ncbi:MAG TPA: hypothetical protein VGD74_07675, partial [Vulgatibacter sp.]
VPHEASVTIPRTRITLDSLQGYRLPIFVVIPRDSFDEPFEVQVEVKEAASGKERKVEGRFLGPSGGHHAKERREHDGHRG